jgi:hypothetical protein
MEYEAIVPFPFVLIRKKGVKKRVLGQGILLKDSARTLKPIKEVTRRNSPARGPSGTSSSVFLNASPG